MKTMKMMMMKRKRRRDKKYQDGDGEEDEEASAVCSVLFSAEEVSHRSGRRAPEEGRRKLRARKKENEKSEKES